MMRPFILVPVVAGACLACSGTPEPPSSSDNLSISAAALSLPGIDFACYDLLIENQDGDDVVALGDPATNLLSPTPDARTICSTRYGNGAGGAITYIAPCDAQRPNHTVTLWVDGFYTGTPESPTAVAYQDPCPDGCTLPATCEENADTLVEFNLTVMRPAIQGFFDVVVNFDDVFCSAKVDCVTSAGPLALLFHPETGARAQTAVLGLACTGGVAGSLESINDTVLFRSPISVACGGMTTLLDPTIGPGNAWGSSNPDPDPSDAIWQVATYIGAEQLRCDGLPCDKRYWNVAIGFDPAVPDCTLTASATVADLATMGAFTTPLNTTYPWIDVELALTGPAGGLACSEHPLDGEPSGVTTRYTAVDAPRHFCHRLDDGGFSSASCAAADTLAALRALSAPHPDAVLVASHSLAGDGGGGTFVWDPDATGPDNDGTVIAPDGASGPGRWIRQYSGPIRPRWFGARADGVTDDCDPVQRAIDTGEDITFDPGVYAIACELEFDRPNATYRALGEVELRLATAGPGRLATISGDDLTWHALTFSGGGKEVRGWLIRIEPDTLRPRFEDCTFGDIAGTKLGSGSETNNQYAFLISPYGVAGFAFIDCTFSDITNDNSAGPYGPTLGVGLGFAGGVFFNDGFAQPTPPQDEYEPTGGVFEGCLFEDIQTLLPPLSADTLANLNLTDRNDADGIRFYGNPGSGHELPVVIRDSTFRRVSKRAIKGSVATGVEVYDVLVDARGLPQAMVTGIKVEAGMIVDGVTFVADPDKPFELLFNSHNIHDAEVANIVANHARGVWVFAPEYTDQVTRNLTIRDLRVDHLHGVGFTSSTAVQAGDNVRIANITMSAARDELGTLIAPGVSAFTGPLATSSGDTGLTLEAVTLANMDVKLDGKGITARDITITIDSPEFVGTHPARGVFELSYTPGLGDTTNLVDGLTVIAPHLGAGYLGPTRNSVITLIGDGATYQDIALTVGDALSTSYPHLDLVGSRVVSDGFVYRGRGYNFISTTGVGPYADVLVMNWRRTSHDPSATALTQFIYANSGTANTIDGVLDELPSTTPSIRLNGGTVSVDQSFIRDFVDPDPTGSFAYYVKNVGSLTTHAEIVQHGGLAYLDNIYTLP